MSFFTSVLLFFASLFSGIEGLFGRSDVIVLYTNDVHCAVDENIGYAGLAAYRDKVAEEYKNVTLVDCGDFIQGELIGSISRGEFIVDIMNYVGYDMAVLGNHEFDYDIEQLGKLIEEADFDILGCNITYSGPGENPLEDIIDYKVVNYGNVQVGFVGVSTPETITTSTPAFFRDDDGNFIYTFSNENLFEVVQNNVDKARIHGADYVIVMSHLGDTDDFAPFSSHNLIENTSGIDAVLDAHAHNVIESEKVLNAKGEEVVLSSTGTKLVNIGQLKISADGEITAELISADNFTGKDKKTEEFIADVKGKFEKELSKVVGKTDFTLSISDENGIRMVRNRETAIANLCADSYRSVTGADIAFVNGGGVRADFKAGDITNGDIINVHPFGNTLSIIEAKGSQIADALEWSSKFTQAEYSDGKEAVGESGGFLHVSGMKYTIDTSVPSSVTSDDKGMFTGVAGARRVKDIMVLENGKYVPIDMNKTYTVASSNYILLNNGGGVTSFDGCKVLLEDGMLDSEALIFYIVNTMSGKISDSYRTTEGRITVK